SAFIAGDVIKVVDPGMTNYSYVGDGGSPYIPSGSTFSFSLAA
ncbi:unnamed protein product, partial [marine sediment metagenome]